MRVPTAEPAAVPCGRDGEESLVITATVAQRSTQRPRGCVLCGDRATGYVTVSRRRGDRRSGPVCDSGLCRGNLVTAMTAELTGWPLVEREHRTELAAPPAPVGTATVDAPAAPPEWVPADDQQIAQVGEWWASLDLHSIEATAMTHLDLCAAAARLAPSGDQTVEWAVTKVLSVIGLAPNMPDNGAGATTWLLCWDVAEDWGRSVAQRWQQLRGDGREVPEADRRRSRDGRCAEL